MNCDDTGANEIAETLADVLRDLHNIEPDLVEQVCADHGLEIDWEPRDA